MENMERELARAKRRNRWLLVMASLTAAVVLAGPLEAEGRGSLYETTRNLPWWEGRLLEVAVLGTISLGFWSCVAVALLIKRIKRRGTHNTGQDSKERDEDDHGRAS